MLMKFFKFCKDMFECAVTVLTFQLCACCFEYAIYRLTLCFKLNSLFTLIR